VKDERSGNRRVGFIDNMGKFVIGPDRLPAGVEVGGFSEGLASICFLDESRRACRGVGFIDERGELVIAPRFRHVGRFSEGLAHVDAEGLTGFINRRGQVVIKLKEEEPDEFREGLAAVRTEQGWGFIDRSGKLVTGEWYTHVERFSEGLAAVAVGLGRRAKYGFINKEGEMVIAPRFAPYLGHHRSVEYLSRFAEGLAAARVDNLYGYINKKGEFVIPPQFLAAGDFSEGLASVQTEKGGWGYIDRSGRWIISLHSGRGYSFKEGLAPVSFSVGHGGKFGYIDRTGRIVIEAKFDNAFPFDGGVAEVYLNARGGTGPARHAQIRSGYIDRAGKYIWEPR
jgi:hypothetical protein